MHSCTFIKLRFFFWSNYTLVNMFAWYIGVATSVCIIVFIIPGECVVYKRLA